MVASTDNPCFNPRLTSDLSVFCLLWPPGRPQRPQNWCAGAKRSRQKSASKMKRDFFTETIWHQKYMQVVCIFCKLLPHFQLSNFSLCSLQFWGQEAENWWGCYPRGPLGTHEKKFPKMSFFLGLKQKADGCQLLMKNARTDPILFWPLPGLLAWHVILFWNPERKFRWSEELGFLEMCLKN